MKRIAWKRGMRLTDDILRASDDKTIELIGKAFVLASANRFGLLPSSKPFEISLNIGNGFIDVESLSCLAVTRKGLLIDVMYDTRYSNNFSTRITIPDMPGVEEYILTIDVQEGQWKDTLDGMEEPIYKFSLLPVETNIPDNSMPIAHIVDEYGWRMDDIDFVPPCLFVASHNKFRELQQRFVDVLAMLDVKSQLAAKSGAHNTIAIFWPLVQQLRIAADKELDLLTPMMLLSNVQKCVSAFTCACALDETIELSDAKMFQSYVLAPYNYREVYQRIKVGLNLCFSIAEKVEKIAESIPAQPESPRQVEPPHKIVAPVLADTSTSLVCNTSESTLSVLYNNPSAAIFFTTDGNTPTMNSNRAAKTRDGYKIKFDNGYRKEKGKEKNKNITIKLIAVVNGESSEIATYTLNLRKALTFRNAIPI